MHGQLPLWDLRVGDLAAKIVAEKKAGAKTFYHFCGVPLPMYKPS